MTARSKHLREWLYALTRYELMLRGKVAKARNAYLKSAASAYEATGTVPNRVIVTHRLRVAETLDAHYRAVIPHFASQAIKQIKSHRFERKETLFESLVQEWVTREALRKALFIADTDRDDVLAAISDGLTDGLGNAEIARNIRAVSQLTPYRAATIARTETPAAATFGSVEAVRRAEQELGVVMLKEWGPTNDDRTRPEHLAMSGYGPIPMNEKFVVGGEQMDRPGDPSASPANQINCRCTLYYSEANE
jgi:hypothetical protein